MTTMSLAGRLLVPRLGASTQVRKFAAEQDAISAEAKALVKRSRQKEAANTKLWEEVHKAAQVHPDPGCVGTMFSQSVQAFVRV